MGKVVPPMQSVTDILAMLTVMSSLDPHMIIELEDENKS
jgi:cephalosporin hydroxylase